MPNDGLGIAPLNPLEKAQRPPEVTDWRGAVSATPQQVAVASTRVARGEQGARSDFRKDDEGKSPERGDARMRGAEVREDVVKAAEKLNKAVDAFDVQVRFEVHEETGRTVVKVVDRSTGELIRQIPPEQILKISAEIQKLVGLLVDEKV